MILATLITMLLVAVTVSVHAAGLALLLWLLARRGFRTPQSFWRMVWLLVRLAWALLLLHGVEIAFWALFYLGAGRLPDAETAFYFSGVTYTTLGYGDVVLPEGLRLAAPLEGLTGILMCGLSTAFFFAAVSKLYTRFQMRDSP